MDNYAGGIAKTDDQVAQLLSERPPGWEYLLYAGALCAGVESLEIKYSDYLLKYAPRLGLMIKDDEFLYFLKSQIGELSLMVGTLNTLFGDEVIEDALGVPGVAGNPDKILHAASRVVRLYEDMLLWAERIRGMAMPIGYRKVIESLVQFISQPVNELRDFVKDFGAQVNELPARMAVEEHIVIRGMVTFSIPDDIVEDLYAQIKGLNK